MRISDLNGRRATGLEFNFEESFANFKLRQLSKADDGALHKEAALEKVEQAKEANVNAVLDMMDRHNEMVKKSQELNRIKTRQQAIERQYQERREEQTKLLGEIALRNAERRDLLEAARLEKR